MSIFSNYYQKDLDKFFSQVVPKGDKKNYVLLPNTLAFVDDVQDYVQKLKKQAVWETRIIVVYFNFLWKPILDLATWLGLRKRHPKEPQHFCRLLLGTPVKNK